MLFLMETLRYYFLLFVIGILFNFHFSEAQRILQRNDMGRERRLAHADQKGIHQVKVAYENYHRSRRKYIELFNYWRLKCCLSPVNCIFKNVVVPDEPRGKDPNCLLPLDRGSCNNMTVMYYYDQTISDCRPFRWYGCNGNANRFSTGQECRSRCWDRYNVIPTRRPVNPSERLQVDQKRPTTKHITNVDLCDEKSELGSCSDYSVKWFYNQTERACRRFWYGGCGGNTNRFDDEKKCKDVCMNRRRPSPDEDPIDTHHVKVAHSPHRGVPEDLRSENFMNTGTRRRPRRPRNW